MAFYWFYSYDMLHTIYFNIFKQKRSGEFCMKTAVKRKVYGVHCHSNNFKNPNWTGEFLAKNESISKIFR